MYWAPTVCEHWRQSSEQKAHKALCSPCPYDSELALQGADIHPLQNSPSAANPHYLEQDSTNAQINMVPGAHYTEKPVWKFLEKIKQMGTNTFWKIMQKIDVMSSKAEQSKTLRQWPWTCRHSLWKMSETQMVQTGLLLWLNTSLKTHLFHLLYFFLGAQT